MNQKDSILYVPYILVAGPECGDAEFYGKWLLAAEKVEALWEEALKDRNFRMDVQFLTEGGIHFDFGATTMLRKLAEDFGSFVFCLYFDDPDRANMFGMMAEMGFYVFKAQGYYEMAIPAELSMEKVKAAALKLYDTADIYLLHPEYLVDCMPYIEAKAFQAGLRKLDKAPHRWA